MYTHQSAISCVVQQRIYSVMHHLFVSYHSPTSNTALPTTRVETLVMESVVIVLSARRTLLVARLRNNNTDLKNLDNVTNRAIFSRKRTVQTQWGYKSYVTDLNLRTAVD